MNCNKCFGKTKVINTRCADDEGGFKVIPKKYKSIEGLITFRVYRCKNCGRTSQSVEIRAESIEQLETDIKARLRESFYNLTKR